MPDIIANIPKWAIPWSDSIRINADLSKITWMRTGGPADYLFKPKDLADLTEFLRHMPALESCAITVLGVCSNVLIRDVGIRGWVIRLGRGFNYIAHKDNTIKAGAAVLDFNVASYAAENGIGGLEFLSGIPGTIGGALYMNGGAYGSDVSAILKSARAINRNGEIRDFAVEEIQYSYRANGLGKEWIFVEGNFQGYPEDSLVIKERILQIKAQREQTQPIHSRTCGSTFKNTASAKAWQLIESSGCKGLRIGDAMVSDMHANFFINAGSATSDQIEQLIAEVQSRVLAKHGVKLNLELEVIGSNDGLGI